MLGHIQTNRSIQDLCFYSDANTFRLFFHCLLKANFKAKAWNDITIKRGQFATSISNLSEQLGLTSKKIRTALEKLEKYGEIRREGASTYTLLTVCNYESYAGNKKEEGKVRASEGQAKGKQRATIEERKNITTTAFLTIDDARDIIYSKFGGVEMAVKSIAAEYKKQTGFAVEELTVQIAIASFIQKGMSEYYTNLTRPDQVIGKMMAWITNQVKHNRVDSYNKKPIVTKKLDYEKYYVKSIFIEHPTPKKHLAYLNKNGIVKKLVSDFNSKTTELQAIKLKYFANYKNVSIYTIYDVIYTPISKTILGMTTEHKMASLKRFVDNLSDYLRNQGNIRSLLKKARTKQHS